MRVDYAKNGFCSCVANSSTLESAVRARMHSQY